MIGVLGLYLWLAPILFFVAGGAGMDAHPFIVASVWGLHGLGLMLYTILVDDEGFRRGWKLCKDTCRQPPGPV